MTDSSEWTREAVIRLAIERERLGKPLNVHTVRCQAAELCRAAERLFGSWANCLSAAGISAGRASAYRRWTEKRMLTTIRTLFSRKHPPTYSDIRTDHFCMLKAAQEHFGSWKRALIAADVDPAVAGKGRGWTRDTIIAAILTKVLHDEPIGTTTVRPSHLYGAAVVQFGTWRAALGAAGLDATKYLGLRRSKLGQEVRTAVAPTRKTAAASARIQCWTREMIQQEITQRIADGKKVTQWAIMADHPRLYYAARRRFGNWRSALQSVGVPPEQGRVPA